jgi:23S rRNA pseudouridine1911/1915/1917 synthase
VASALKDQFEARKPDREYVAIAAGKIADSQGTIRSHLTTNEDLDQYSTDTPGEGKLAVTHFKVERRLRGATWLRVRLETGRRNQIRVHLAEAGHPILGDVRYEVDLARHPAWKWSRLALHAQSLGFTHPVTGKDIRVTSQIPSCFEDFARATRL